MKHNRDAASVTSLPQAPKAEGDARTRSYLISMGIRMLCFALTVLVTPYGWYTWVFAIAAAVLPYIAVVRANTGRDGNATRAESPEQALPPARPADAESAPQVLTVHENREPTE